MSTENISTVVTAGVIAVTPAAYSVVPVPSPNVPPTNVNTEVVERFDIHPLAIFDFKRTFETDPLSAAENFLELLLEKRACLERAELFRKMELVRNRSDSLGGYASRMPEEFLRELYWVANGQLLDAVALETQEPQRELEAGRRIARLANHPDTLLLAHRALLGGDEVLEDLALRNSSRLHLWLHEQLESKRLQAWLLGDLPGDGLSGQWLAAWRRIPRNATREAALANLAVAPSFDVAKKMLAERWLLDDRVIVDIQLD
ncbi:MAG: hypothetical protein ACK5EA_19975 [Planctomycetaceae bacterium]|jgi:hypothetical protein